CREERIPCAVTLVVNGAYGVAEIIQLGARRLIVATLHERAEITSGLVFGALADVRLELVSGDALLMQGHAGVAAKLNHLLGRELGVQRVTRDVLGAL